MDVKKAKEQAVQELNEEREKEAKERLKSKLKELNKAQMAVKNIEREIEDLEDELFQKS